MKSQPIPGSTGEVLTELPSPYLPHAATGLLHLPRFIAKINYTKANGSLPQSYRKNYKRGLDRFLCAHLNVEPADVEKTVTEAATDAERDAALLRLFPADVRAHVWNRELVQRGMSEAGREFILEALTNMGCADRIDEVKGVADLIELDEGRL